MNKANEEIRELIESNRLRYWEVAAQIGINDASLSRWLRIPMNENRKDRVVKAIGELLEVRQKQEVN